MNATALCRTFSSLVDHPKTEITFPTGREILHAGISDFEAWAYCCLIRAVMSQVDEQNVKPFYCVPTSISSCASLAPVAFS